MESTKKLANTLEAFREKKEECKEYLKDVANHLKAFEDFHNEICPKIHDDSQSDKNNEKELISSMDVDEVRKKIENDKLKILIAGQFKTGKSTCINAMLGEDILPAYSTPCTAVITELNYSDHPSAELFFKEKIDNIPEDLCDKAKNHIKNDLSIKGKVEPLHISNSEHFADELEDYLVIPMSTKEQGESVSESPYSLCKLFWPLELCKQDVEIIDSPGINEAEQRDETTMSYIPKVDMVIHVLTALQIYSKADEAFDNDIQSYGNPPVVFLTNRFDQLNSDRERERIKEYVFNKLQLDKKTSFGKNAVLFVSGLKALEARNSNNEKEFVESGFSSFENILSEIISSERGKIKFGHIKSIADNLEAFAKNRIDVLRNLLSKDSSELKKKFESNQKVFKELEERSELINNKIVKELDSLQKELTIEIRAFFDDFSRSPLEEAIKSAEVKIGFWNKKSDIESGVKKLSNIVQSEIKNEFNKWSQNEGQSIIKDKIDSIKETIDWDLRQFHEGVYKIRQDLDIGRMSSPDIDTSDFIAAAVAGGTLGSILSGGAVFLASRFIAVLTGPVGWAATGLFTLGSALLALFTNNEGEQLKNKFIDKARDILRERSKEMSATLAKDIHDSMAEGLNEIKIQLNRTIESEKNNIKEAIAMSEKKHEEIEQQKLLLESHYNNLINLANKGRNLTNTL